MAATKTLREVEELDDVAFHRALFKAIRTELGMAGILRFIRLYGPHEGNFTEERREWMKGVTAEELLDATRSYDASRRARLPENNEGVTAEAVQSAA